MTDNNHINKEINNMENIQRSILLRHFQVFYAKPDMTGESFHAHNNVDPDNLEASHVFVKNVVADSLDEVFMMMQGEIWSPNGEANDLITSKGLAHTSMSVGDVIKINTLFVDDEIETKLFKVMGTGFKMIHGKEIHKGMNEYELNDAFNLIADPNDWKAPIDKIVDHREISENCDLEHIGVLEIKYAAEFFVGTEVNLTYNEDGKNTNYGFTSEGYRAGPCGDH